MAEIPQHGPTSPLAIRYSSRSLQASSTRNRKHSLGQKLALEVLSWTGEASKIDFSVFMFSQFLRPNGGKICFPDLEFHKFVSAEIWYALSDFGQLWIPKVSCKTIE